MIPYRCISCGYMFEPAAPRWLLVIGIAVGLGLAGINGYGLLQGWKFPLENIFWGVIGLVVAGGSLLRLIRGLRPGP